MTATDTLARGDTLEISLPDGRELHIWYHHCDSCTSLDVWTDRGVEVEPISMRTGRTSTAPVGVMGWRGGSRFTFDTEPIEGSHNWPAVGTVTLVWHDEPQP